MKIARETNEGRSLYMSAEYQGCRSVCLHSVYLHCISSYFFSNFDASSIGTRWCFCLFCVKHLLYWHFNESICVHLVCLLCSFLFQLASFSLRVPQVEKQILCTCSLFCIEQFIHIFICIWQRVVRLCTICFWPFGKWINAHGKSTSTLRFVI